MDPTIRQLELCDKSSPDRTGDHHPQKPVRAWLDFVYYPALLKMREKMLVILQPFQHTPRNRG